MPAAPQPARPAARRGRRWVWFFLYLAAAGAVAVTVPLVYNLTLQLTPAQLAAARARWQAEGPRDYDLQYKQMLTRGGEAEESEWVVRVRGGKVVAVTCDGEPLLPDPAAGLAAGPAVAALPAGAYQGLDVEGKFARMEADLARDAAEGRRSYTTAVFDARDGHPLRYVRRVRAAGERLEWELMLKPPAAGDP
jgi:hypothetical protein